MQVEPAAASRALRTERVEADLVVVGGGLSGVCAAITAARAGARVVLCGDRPVLGGNASSEVRLWCLGATSHMGNNNRWAREGGVADEILVENLWRNREGNPCLFDTILLELALAEPNLQVLLNTAAYAVDKADADTIAGVRAFCSQNSTAYELVAPLFCDASGDGIVGFLAGAAFRMGAEAADEFGEPFAPDQEYGALLGHSMYFYSRDTGAPVTYVPPSFAYRNIPDLVPRYRAFNTRDHGCRLWWIEHGGRLDTVHDTEAIRWELWRVVYGVWDYIKNSGAFPDAANLTLEWVSTIPGKRESRRFAGDCWLTQRDLIEQTEHPDVVAHGGWGIDLHPADGVFSPLPGCTGWHARGVYGIPYRCLYSRNIGNLFLVGRLTSATHVAFGSTRVMLTGAVGAQAVGVAAALCRRDGVGPRALSSGPRLVELQAELLRRGQHLPRVKLADEANLACRARLTASSRLHLAALPADGPSLALDQAVAQLLPLAEGPAPRVTFLVDVAAPTTLTLDLRTGDRTDNFTPDCVQARQSIDLPAGDCQTVVFDPGVRIDAPRYACYALAANPLVRVHTSEQRLSGVLALTHRRNQTPDGDIGVAAIGIWTPSRRPGGQNLALTIDPPLDSFSPEAVVAWPERPTCGANAWLAAPDDPRPTLRVAWDAPQRVGRVELSFDTDFDHPMESVLMGHPERVAPFCVRHYRLLDADGRVLAEVTDNHTTRVSHRYDPPLTTTALTIELLASHGPAPAALFGLRCYADPDDRLLRH